jgi:adenylylsulfate kinase
MFQEALQGGERRVVMESKVFMMYMVGTSGSGKTTIAAALEDELKNRGMKRLQVIDGDVIREQFGGIFGYTYEERMKCNQAVRVVVDYLTQVAAYEEIRKLVRNQFAEHYIQVYVKCSYEECARRDVKGHYKKNLTGEVQHLNGVDDAYEVPAYSDIVVDTEKETLDEEVKKILKFLEENGYGV